MRIFKKKEDKLDTLGRRMSMQENRIIEVSDKLDSIRNLLKSILYYLKKNEK